MSSVLQFSAPIDLWSDQDVELGSLDQPSLDVLNNINGQWLDQDQQLVWTDVGLYPDLRHLELEESSTSSPEDMMYSLSPMDESISGSISLQVSEPWLHDQSIPMMDDPLSWTKDIDSVSMSASEPSHHACAQCERRFTKYQQLERHSRDEGHPSFACTHCDKCFSRRDTLQRHMANHKAPQFTCKGCRRSFARRDHFKSHAAKCPHRRGVLREADLNAVSGRRGSAMSSGSSGDEAEHRLTKIIELMGPSLSPEQLSSLQNHLATLDEVRCQGLCKDLAHTIIQNIRRETGTT